MSRVSYRRKPTRSPRIVEQTAAMREVDELRLALEKFAARNRELTHQNLQLSQKVIINGYEVEKLLHDKVALAMELRKARFEIQFLKGRGLPGWPDA